MPLIDDLRARIRDTRPHYRALSIAVSDVNSNGVVCEVTNGRLVVTVIAGSTGLVPIDVDLTESRYSTIGRLAKALMNMDGYLVQVDEDANLDHLSIDIDSIGPVPIGTDSSGINLCTYLFSTVELDSLIKDATARHNPSFDPNNIPDSERIFVLQLAQAEVCRRQAYDSTKRRGLDQEVNDLLAIADALEKTYEADTRRLKRALASPKEATPHTMDQGDIVLGQLVRRNLRSGYMAPLASNIAPEPPVLLDAEDPRDIEDDNIRVRWIRNKDHKFHSAELWMDVVEDVQRSSNSSVRETADSDLNSGQNRPTTSKLVFRSLSANRNVSPLMTFVEEFGQIMTSFNVPNLEPESVYFFRLFVADLNHEMAGSNVQRMKTLPLRARFAANTPTNVTTAASGDVITVNFDTTKGVITASHTIRLGDREVALTVITSYQATFVVPQFTQKSRPKNLVVYSPTRLFDILPDYFTVSP